MAAREKIIIFWFRRDLRLQDNTGLFMALEDKYPVLPLFIFDSNILDDLSEKNDPRVGFIHRRVSAMHNALEQVDSTLLVRRGSPLDVFRALTSEYNVHAVYTNRDYEPYATERDAHVQDHLHKSEIGFHTFKDQVIFEGKEICKDNGEPYKVFTPYKNRWLASYRDQPAEQHPIDLKDANLYKTKPATMPSLKSLGFEAGNITIPEAQLDEELIQNYHKTRDFPGIDGTTRIGIHLRHGTISIRKAVSIGYQINDTWLNELIWREFYMMILANYSHVVTRSFKPEYDRIPWQNNEEQFEAWCAGKTGYPIVDAGMRQLNTTGYMHNRVRMITASFLTKHLLIDWRWGESYFAKKLLDYELSSNNGGWQWAAGTGTDAQPYFRVFNPWSQADKYDPDGDYVRQWVPEIDDASYPDPIVDHKSARERAIKTYKQAVS
jgi:deoxyribodipyrimidine photo-lyase